MTETRYYEPPGNKPLSICLVALSSYAEASAHLGFHWIWRLLNRHNTIFCDRAYPDAQRGRESHLPLGGMEALLFSLPYEEHLLTLLRRLHELKIASRWRERSARSPLIIVGGHGVRLLPALLKEIADVLVLGDAEPLVPPLLDALALGDKESILGRLDSHSGFFVRGRGGEEGHLSLSRSGYSVLENHPIAAYTTPNSAFPNAFLTEVGRGCSQRCSFCFISHAQGSFVPFHRDLLLSLPERFPGADKFGLVGAAVGDHPDFVEILQGFAETGRRVTLSSLKLTSLSDDLLKVLHACGARNLTLAPEAGTFRLRRELHKAIPDEMILDGVGRAARLGFYAFKFYFLLGVPGEEEEDVDGIINLVGAMRHAVRPVERETGRSVRFTVSLAPFVPKPITPWADHAMARPALLRERWRTVRKGLASLGGIRLSPFDLRRGVKQARLLNLMSDDLATLEAEAVRGVR